MNRKRRFILPLGILALLLVPFLWRSALAASSFYDVTDDTLYSPYIQKLYDAHLITGDTDNGKETFRFRPKDSLTRAEFTKVAVGVKLAEKYGMKEDWQSKSAYEITETVLKDKLLYFHGCSNADLSNCTSLCSADICGVCNVCQIIGEKPFTDVAVKSRDCEEEGVCTPWYSEYIYYALRKGMVKGYREGSGYAFHPNDPILRIHALKLVMADDGAVDPEADERYRVLSQLAKAKGAYFPKCLVGAEQYILKNNGGEGSSDGEKLLKYALLADKLDLFGNSCQIFAEKGARTPEERAAFLQKPITRQEVARYFVISSTYPPIFISPFEDDTVDGVVNNTQDPESVVTKVITDDGDVAWDFSGIKLGTLNVYSDNEPIPIEDVVSPDSGFESTFNRAACILTAFKPMVCRDASTANCIDVPNGSRIHTTEEEFYGRTPTGYYTWLWHGVVYNGIGYYTPLDDIDFDCERTLQWEEAKRQAAAEQARINAYNAKVRKQNAANAAAYKKQQAAAAAAASAQQETPWYMSTLGDLAMSYADPYVNFGKNVINYNIQLASTPNPNCSYLDAPGMYGNPKYGFPTYLSTAPLVDPNPVMNNPVTKFVLDTGGWVTDNIGKPVAEATNKYVVQPIQSVHKITVDAAEYVGNGVKNVASEADKYIMQGFNASPDWLKPAVQPIRSQYNISKGVLAGGGTAAEGVFQIYKDPVGVANGIGTAITHPGETWSAVSKGVGDFANESFSSQDKFEENSGRMIFEVGSLFVGIGEIRTTAKVAEIAKVVTTAEKVAEVTRFLDKVEDLGTIARGLEKVEDVSRVSKVLTGVTDIEKTAGIISKMQPAKAVEVVLGLSKTKTGAVLSKMDDIAAARLITSAKGTDKLVQALGTLSLTKTERVINVLKLDEAVQVIAKMEAGRAGKIVAGMDSVKAANILERLDIGVAAKVAKAMQATKAGSALLQIRDTGKAAQILRKLSQAESDAILTQMAERLKADYSKMVPTFKGKLQTVADKFKVQLDTEKVLKETSEIVRKANEEGRDISQAWDIMRGRWIVDTEEQAYAIAKYVDENYNVHYFTDNFLKSKSSGYRSLHYYIKIDGKIAEVQIVPRTMFEANDETHIILEALRNPNLMPDKVDELNKLIVEINEKAWKAFTNR